MFPKPELRDPFEIADAEAKAWDEAEAAANPTHAQPIDVSPFMTSADARDMRGSVRALGIILVRYEATTKEMIKATREQTQVAREHAKISQAILDELITQRNG